MKFRMLTLGLFSLSVIAPLSTIVASPAAAVGCVGVDVSNQIALHGSADGVQQNNESTMTSSPHCFGSVGVNVGNQVYTGPGEGFVQERESHQSLDGINNPTPYGNEYLPTDGENIFIPVQTQTDIYVPVYDPNFYDSYLGDPISPAEMYAYQ